jgi:hypothetical protein
MTGPMKPSDVRAMKTATIPEGVFAVFNRLIAASWDGHEARVSQKVAASEVSAALNIPRSEVYERHYLDVEESYRALGWNVEYDKPGYNETYDATFHFTLGKRG